MRKSIRLKLKLKVEGEAEPAADFEALAAQAVRDLIATGQRAQSSPPALKVTVKELAEDTDEEEADSAPAK
jgi:hypothetical protein